MSKALERFSSASASVFATPFLWSGHLQSYWCERVKGRSSPLEDLFFSRDSVKTKRGSEDECVDLDWLVLREDAAAVLVVINHGSASEGVHGFLNDLLRQAELRRFAVCLVSLGSEEGLRLTSSGWNAALEIALERVTAKLGKAKPKVLVAASLGGLPALHFLASANAKEIHSAVIVATPLQEDLGSILASDSLSARAALRASKSFLKGNARESLTSTYPERVEELMASDSLQLFYSTLFAGGAVSTVLDLDSLALPVLFLYGGDDPWVRFGDSVDLVRMLRKENFVTCVAERGGHCGFFGGWKGERWPSELVLDFITGTLLQIY
jgi:predicted alpha/beta-fold hydrolase